MKLRSALIIGCALLGLSCSSKKQTKVDKTEPLQQIAAKEVPKPNSKRPVAPEGMVVIPRATFKSHRSFENADQPWFEVTVDRFALGKTEVTVEAYQKCLAANKCSDKQLNGQHWQGMEFTKSEECNWGQPGREKYPLNCVTFEQAENYCKYLGGRLPIQNEWQLAAGGGKQAKYPWGEKAADCSLAVIYSPKGPGCGSYLTSPVGSRPQGASAQGVLDLVGNVSEWTAPALDGGKRALHFGGSLVTQKTQAEYYRWGSAAASERSAQIGFRCAKDI